MAASEECKDLSDEHDFHIGERGISIGDQMTGPPLPHPTLLKAIADYEARAEQAYADMYETRYPAGEYSDLKEYFALAIEAARRAGLSDEVERLSKRLEHCIQVYRKQFSTF
jgi:hypothetical protein